MCVYVYIYINSYLCVYIDMYAYLVFIRILYHMHIYSYTHACHNRLPLLGYTVFGDAQSPSGPPGLGPQAMLVEPPGNGACSSILQCG